MLISKKTIINIFFPLISGIAVSLSYYNNLLSFLIFASLVPYVFSIIYSFSFYKLFIYSVPLYITSLIWLINPVSKITDIIFFRFIISILLILIISIFLSLMLNIPFLIFKMFSCSNVAKAILFPFIYIFGEWLQGIFVPIAFPWIRLGNISAMFTTFIQSASVFGTLFISFLILFINAFIALFFYYRKNRIKYLFLLSALLIVTVNLTFGHIKLKHSEENKISESSVIIVQGNYPRESKFTSTPDEILEKYISLVCSEDINKVDLILFPETSMHSDIYTIPKLKSKISEFCYNHKSLLLFGSQYNEKNEFYNACMAIYPENVVDAVYRKRILVPFGEYNPFKINSLHFTTTDFSSGDECSLIKFKNGQIGCAICFESIFPSSVSESVKNGANVITILTNDSWLGQAIPLYQHHTHSIMRAVENNRYVLTATNTGISSIINENGKVLKESNLNTEAIINGNFYMNSNLSFYTKYGDVIILPSCTIIIFLCIKFIFRELLLIFKKA